MHKYLYVAIMTVMFAAYGAAAFSGGDGSQLNPYQVSNSNDIYELANNISYLDDNFIVTADIDLQGFVYRPIGDYTNRFTGVFDGNGHSISNMRIEGSTYSYSGMFGVVGEGAVVRNVNIVSGVVSSTYQSWLYTGTIAGINKGLIADCTVNGRLTGSSQTTYGGLAVGYNDTTGEIRGCGVSGTISISYCGGGIAGFNYNLISDCYFNGNVIVNRSTSALNASGYSGGIVGINGSGAGINYCSSTGVVTANINEPSMQTSLRVGGIAGSTDSSSSVTLSSSQSSVTAVGVGQSAEVYCGGVIGRNSGSLSGCFGLGNVSAQAESQGSSAGAYAGGAIGSNFGSVSDCYARGNAYSESSGSPNLAFSGGFCGRQSSGDIDNCYSTGTAGGTQNNGAFAGGISAGEISDSFWNYETSGFDPASHSGIYRNAGGSFELFAVNTAQMQTASTFTAEGWDMTNTWQMSGQSGYPEINGVKFPVTYMADLIVFSSSLESGVINAGEQAQLNVSIRNTGEAAASVYFHTTVYISDNPSVSWESLDDSAVAASINCQPLAVGSTANKVFNVDIPTSSQTVYLRVKVDRFNSVDESDETNNWGQVHIIEVVAYAGGSGSEADPFVIETAEQFNTIGSRPADWDKYFVLVSDIDMSGFDYNMIGSGGASGFGGSFDGGGHVISNVTITDVSVGDYYGVFGSINAGGSVKDLGIKDITINAPNGYYIGPIAGWCRGTISRCFAEGMVVGDFFVGGICGGLSGEGAAITDCYSLAVVTASSSPAGIAAYAIVPARIENSYYAGRLISGDYAAGIVTFSQQATVVSCFFDASAAGTWWSAAGEAVSSQWLTNEDNLTAAGWDYITAWHQVDGEYPLLRWQELIIAADLDGDGLINSDDLAIMAGQWLSEGPGLSADIRPVVRDGVVNLLDYAFLADAWLR